VAKFVEETNYKMELKKVSIKKIIENDIVLEEVFYTSIV
jgi:hypothetical protein